MDDICSALGYTGALLTLFAYFQVSRGRWHAKSRQYQVTNAFAGLFLIAYSWYVHAFPNVLLNAAWLIIAIVGLSRMSKR